MRPREARWPGLRSALYLALIFAVFIVHVVAVRRFTTDDAGITYAYALHLGQGQGFRAVVGGPTVEGYSNFLWLVVLCAAFKLGAAIPLAAKIIGGLLGGCGILLAIGLLQRLSGRRGGLVSADLALGLLIALSAEYTIWSIGGLENPLLACLLLGLITRCIDESDQPNRFPFSALLGLGVSLTRPEGVLYVVAMFGIWAVVAIRERRGLHKVRNAVGIFFVLFAIYHAWHYAQFLDLRPNTFYAKRPTLDRAHLRDGWRYFFMNCQTGMLTLGAPFALLAGRRLFTRRLFLIKALGAGFFFILYAGGDWMGHFRLGAHLIPIYAVLVVLGAQELAALPFLRRSWVRSGLLYGVELCLVALFVYRQQINTNIRTKIDRESSSHFQRVLNGADAMYDQAKKLDILPATVAVHDFGGFAWRSDAQFQPIDYLGLCDIGIAHIFDSWPHRQERARRALLQNFFRERGPHPSLIYLPSGSFFANLENSVDQLQAYYHMTTPNGFLLLVHRGSLLHYQPPFEQFLFRPLLDGNGERLRLLGFAARGVMSPNQQVSLRLGLLTRTPLFAVHNVTVKIAVRSAAERRETEPKTLFGGAAVLLYQWQPGEPLYIELPIVLPEARGTEYSFELGLRYDGGPWQWQPLGGVPVGANLTAAESPLPRFPSGLPGPNAPTLVALEEPLQRLWQRRQSAADLTIIDRPLAAALVQEGKLHEKRGELEDSYLSYVWAIQADPDRTAALYRPVAVLRDRLPNHDADFKRQLELLHLYYTDGSPIAARHLVDYLTAHHYLAEARYFSEHLPK